MIRVSPLQIFVRRAASDAFDGVNQLRQYLKEAADGTSQPFNHYASVLALNACTHSPIDLIFKDIRRKE